MKHFGSLMVAIRARQRLGKYRIERKLGEGGFAAVYQAYDTIEGVRVALKIPYETYLNESLMEEFRREVRLAAQLKHPNVLSLKNADFIDGRFVVAFPLGQKTLADRLQSRIALPLIISFAEQMIAAVAHAHEHRIIHCDIKPDNFILFSGNKLRLSDFGIARIALRTVKASGSGTVGYIAPEQAMGKPSYRSDVFSLGLVIYRMLSGHLPEWPFAWPPSGYDRVRQRVHPDMITFLQRSISIHPKTRYRDAGKMLMAFRRIRQRVTGPVTRTVSPNRKSPDWKTVRRRQFQSQFGKILETQFACPKCEGPVSESMQHCPWCGDSRNCHHDDTKFPQCCPRCHRGMKLDWEYCPWCFGPGFELSSSRTYSDTRYSSKCSNHECERKLLMPFMRYCPWCHRKVKRKWEIPGCKDKCSSCGWGAVKGFWTHCAWCGTTMDQ